MENRSLTVTEAVLSRHSVRAFRDRPVARATIEAILDAARRAPSGGNLQPWRVDVFAGAPLAELKAAAKAHFPPGATPEYDVYPPNLCEPWRSRRFEVGEQLHGSVGIGREDRPARLARFAENFDLFGAPVALFFSIPRSFGPPQWAHLGMFLQTLMLLAVERGLGSCAQEAWAIAHDLVGPRIGLEPDWMLYCGMALGYPDATHPINGWRSDRAPVEEFARFRGFDR